MVQPELFFLVMILFTAFNLAPTRITDYNDKNIKQLIHPMYIILNSI